MQFPGFVNHQRGARLDREAPSRIPPQPGAATEQVRSKSGAGTDKVPLSKEKRSEVKRSEVKRSEVKRREAKGERAAPAWAARLRDRWTHRGQGPLGAIQRELGSSVAVHGDDVILRAIDTYATARLAEGKPMKLVWFAEEVVTWIQRGEPLVDNDGILTERGMAVAASA